MKMTILHTETLKRWGGQQNRILSEAVGLNKRGHHAVIACHRGSMLARKSKEAGVKVYEVKMVKQAHLQTIPKLIKIIRDEVVDIVSTHSSVDSWAGGLAARLTGRRLVRFRHNLYPIGRDPLTKFIYAMPNRFIAISNAVKDVLTGGGLSSSKISVVPSSVNTERFSPDAGDIRKELDLPADAVVIGNTATFTQVKGYEYLLQAFSIIGKRYPAYLLFAGEIEERFKESKIFSHVDRSLRDKVLLLGGREDVPRVLNTIDIFVYPSFLEGLGTALLEAMIMARPVVVSDIPTFREFIEDDVNGLFFEAKNPDDLAKKVMSLLENKISRTLLGKNARSTALERFTVGDMIDLTEAQYKEVINAK